MSVALPGRLIAHWEGPGGLPFGKVAFGQVVREVCLACTPQARVGDYLIVDLGMALEVLDESAARATLGLWREFGLGE